MNPEREQIEEKLQDAERMAQRVLTASADRSTQAAATQQKQVLEEAVCSNSQQNVGIVLNDGFKYAVTLCIKLEELANRYSWKFSFRGLDWTFSLRNHTYTLGCNLKCVSNTRTKNWSCYAHITIEIKSHDPEERGYMRQARKNFTADDARLTYANYISNLRLRDALLGYVQNDSIVLQLCIIVHPELRLHTGYVGLRNESGTCFMNALLQTLYFTYPLREAIKKLALPASNHSTTVGQALNSIFKQLQSAEAAVQNNELIAAMGWQEPHDMQTDAQEFLRILLEKLDTEMFNTALEGTISKVFAGEIVSYVKCQHVDYTSMRRETFYDIQLTVKNMKNIYQSFAHYIAPEQLEGDNKYAAGIHGLQEATKGLIFVKFPPILYLHLLRFEYDEQQGEFVKNNERFEFYEQINLDAYLQEREQTPAEYVLQSVLVHTGGHDGEHYHVCIKPNGNGNWYRFEDDFVSVCTAEKAIEDNFGGKYGSYDSAYMLIYVRKSELECMNNEAD